MGVPLDGISIVIRNERAEKRLPRGLDQVREATNGTFRSDGELTAVSFQSDLDAFLFTLTLRGMGLRPTVDFSTLDRTPTWLGVEAKGQNPEFVMRHSHSFHVP